MGLNIGVGRAKQLLGTLDGQRFRDIDEFAAAVVALAGIAFGILVRQHRALGFEHARTRIVLRGDKFDMILLTAAFARRLLAQVRNRSRQWPFWR